VLHPDKSISWIKVFGKVMYDELGRPVKIYGTVMDQTDQKMSELRKNQFIGVASHELKTPLTSVKAYAQLLTNTYSTSKDNFLKTALAKIDTQVNKMTKLVSDFLNLSKIESDRFDPVMDEFDLGELIKEVAADIQLSFVTHTISLELLQGLVINGDREKISQVITNFLINAVKYSPGQKEVRVITERSNDNAIVKVWDNGIGVAREEHLKVFERFYRSKFNDNISFSGFGIGLYISAEIIRRHGGEIGVDSEIGKGSIFYFILPLAAKMV
jgi:two-component system CheB/CheR fusion protein